MKLIIGTRSSRLARAQSEAIAEEILHLHPHVEIEYRLIQTEGDRRFGVDLQKFAGAGVFTKEIEHALLDGKIDLAVHSYKDLPTAETAGLTIGCVPRRGSWRDVLIARRPLHLDEKGTESLVIGTSSPRRKAQLLRLNPNLEIKLLRGNVPTRMRKLMEGEYDGIVLAEAGLDRLKESYPWSAPFMEHQMLPAPGQGALAIQIRDDHPELRNLLEVMHHTETAHCVELERAFLKRLGGGCHLAAGARVVMLGGHAILYGRILSEDGSKCFEKTVSGMWLEREKMLDEFFTGFEHELYLSNFVQEDIVDDLPADDQLPLKGKRIAVTRDEDSDGPLCTELRKLGAEPVPISLIKINPVHIEDRLLNQIMNLPFGTWMVLSSQRAVEVMMSIPEYPIEQINRHGFRFAAIAEKTASLLRKYGLNPEIVGGEGGAEALLERFARTQEMERETVFLPQSNLALEKLEKGFAKLGAEVVTEVVYQTTILPENGKMLCRMIEKNQLDAITFTSPSAVDSFKHAWGNFQLPKQPIIATIGPTTTSSVTGKGWCVHVESEETTVESLAKALAEFINSHSSSTS